VDVWGPSKSLNAVDGQHGLAGQVVDGTRGQVGAPAGSPADDTLASSVLSILGPVFCLPVNKTLLARWDRVEDRMWKLHHCLDLDGVRRDLALFAPELDPMSRVAATALGLTPDDLVSDVAADVPPYRFAYLIERAKVRVVPRRLRRLAVRRARRRDSEPSPSCGGGKVWRWRA
jgi:hypothetical protein